MASTYWTRAGNASLVVCALVVTTVLVRREFFSSGVREGAALEFQDVPDWRRYQESGHSIGAERAPVELIVFSDFECPACRVFFMSSLRGVMESHRGRIKVTVRHFPLSYHRFAYPAARASECAGAQSRFIEFHELIFRKQDSLGLKTFEAFATESGVSDIRAFNTCVSSAQKVTAIEVDLAAGRKVAVRGTPGVIMNGRLYSTPPDSASLERFVSVILAGKP